MEEYGIDATVSLAEPWRVIRLTRQRAPLSCRAHEEGRERWLPADFLPTFAHAVIDAGADIVVGHGPHLLHGLEFYKGKPIFYSLGNFIFEHETLERMAADDYDTLKRPDVDAGPSLARSPPGSGAVLPRRRPLLGDRAADLRVRGRAGPRNRALPAHAGLSTADLGARHPAPRLGRAGGCDAATLRRPLRTLRHRNRHRGRRRPCPHPRMTRMVGRIRSHVPEGMPSCPDAGRGLGDEAFSIALMPAPSRSGASSAL